MKTDIGRLLREGKSVLLADGGSTKMEWILASDNRIVWRHTVPGVNPLVSGLQAMSEAFEQVAAILPEKPAAIGYYGAGCVEAVCAHLAELASLSFSCPAECGSDLLLAARMLCGRSEGLVCILGTGSNSGLFRDGEMIRHVPSLGYLLGDEGGAVYMGRQIVTGCLRGIADKEACEQWNSLDISEHDALACVYGTAKKPSAWLGDIVRRMAPAYTASTWLKNVVRKSLDDFFVNVVQLYRLQANTPVYFAGTTAHHFADILRQLGSEYGMHIADIIARPFDKISNKK